MNDFNLGGPNTVGTVLSAAVVINFENFYEAILVVNLVRFLFKKII